ncbi:MAG: GGDEF domain-containing protein [Candidatus Limnocylindria bacterium]
MPPDPTRGCADMAASLGVDDILVFVRSGERLSLLGGAGRGIGWARVVDIDLADEPLAAETIRRGRPRRVEASDPNRIIGPYYVERAALIPLGDGHLVVFGASRPITVSDGELLRAAAESAAACGDTPSAKLLADELEVVHAVRQLMEYRPESIAATATHVASVAADALGCEIGIVMVEDKGVSVVGGAGSGWPAIADHPQLHADLEGIAGRARLGSVVEQEVHDDPLDLRLVSRYALRIGSRAPVATLMVGHSSERARGFTMLCQRVGRALADAAEVLLAQAAAREELARERDAFAHEARTDPLTGLGNRIAWEEALRREEALFSRHAHPTSILSLDVDHLRETNERFGHSGGDEILVAAAEVLNATMRSSDVVVRLGGDEFAAILPMTDAEASSAVENRIADAMREWSGSKPELGLSISVGSASAAPGEPLRETFRRADEALMRSKSAR